MRGASKHASLFFLILWPEVSGTKMEIPEMKIIVVSRGDERRWHTLKLLAGEGIQCVVVAHNKDVRKKIHRTFPMHEVVQSDTTELVDKRNWILENLVDRKEWFIGMDDNIQGFTMVRKKWRKRPFNKVTDKPPDGFDSWRQVYNHKVSAKLWLKEFKKDVELAKSQDIPLVGVATMENPYFRAKRYSNYRFVKTKVYAMENHPKFLFFENKISHDSWLTALCIANFGKVLVDSYLHHITKMYEVGGLGNREERERRGLLDYMQHTIDSFPGLVGMGHGKNTALRFLLTREKSVERWREENNYV